MAAEKSELEELDKKPDEMVNTNLEEEPLGSFDENSLSESEKDPSNLNLDRLSDVDTKNSNLERSSELKTPLNMGRLGPSYQVSITIIVVRQSFMGE